MKRILWIVAIPIFFQLAYAGNGEENQLSSNKAFHEGEKLVYRVHYGWITAGETVFEVKKNEKVYDNRHCYHIAGEGYSQGAFNWFFKVRDTYDSYVDKSTLLPLKYWRDVDEGGYTFYSAATFDHHNNTTTTQKGKYDVPVGIQDMLSSVYYLRTIDLDGMKKNDVIPIDIFLDNELYHLQIRYIGTEVLKTSLGKFKTHKLQPQIISGNVFDEDSKMYVYVSADENKIPIRIESEILVGSVTADLKSFKGLKNKLTSKID